MPYDSDWQRRQRARWLHHDAHLWIRHDAARFVRPGFDPADVFPTLARKPPPVKVAAADDAFAEWLAAERRLSDAIKAALAEVKAEMARRRALDGSIPGCRDLADYHAANLWRRCRNRP
jgi:hypothetical protein